MSEFVSEEQLMKMNSGDFKRYEVRNEDFIKKDKNEFAESLKKGLGKNLVEELKNVKPLTRRKKFINKLKKIIGI